MDCRVWNGSTGGVGNRAGELESRGAWNVDRASARSATGTFGWRWGGFVAREEQRGPLQRSARAPTRGGGGGRSARVSTVRVQRAVAAPMVLCASRNVRAGSMMSTLCRTGAVAESAWRVRCGASSVLSSSTASPACPVSSPCSHVGFFWFAAGEEGEYLRFVGGWGEDCQWRSFRARCADAWMSGQASRRCGASSARAEPPDTRRNAVSRKFRYGLELMSVVPQDMLAISGGIESLQGIGRNALSMIITIDGNEFCTMARIFSLLSIRRPNQGIVFFISL